MRMSRSASRMFLRYVAFTAAADTLGKHGRLLDCRRPRDRRPIEFGEDLRANVDGNLPHISSRPTTIMHSDKLYASGIQAFINNLLIIRPR